MRFIDSYLKLAVDFIQMCHQTSTRTIKSVCKIILNFSFKHLICQINNVIEDKAKCEILITLSKVCSVQAQGLMTLTTLLENVKIGVDIFYKYMYIDIITLYL